MPVVLLGLFELLDVVGLLPGFGGRGSPLGVGIAGSPVLVLQSACHGRANWNAFLGRLPTSSDKSQIDATRPICLIVRAPGPRYQHAK